MRSLTCRVSFVLSFPAREELKGKTKQNRDQNALYFVISIKKKNYSHHHHHHHIQTPATGGLSP